MSTRLCSLVEHGWLYLTFTTHTLEHWLQDCPAAASQRLCFLGTAHLSLSFLLSDPQEVILYALETIPWYETSRAAAAAVCLVGSFSVCLYGRTMCMSVKCQWCISVFDKYGTSTTLGKCWCEVSAGRMHFLSAVITVLKQWSDHILVTLVPKKTPPTDFTHLRPISVTSIMSHVTERLIVRKYLLPALPSDQILDQYAYPLVTGFPKRHTRIRYWSLSLPGVCFRLADFVTSQCYH